MDATFASGMGHLFRTLALATKMRAQFKTKVIFLGEFSEESRQILQNRSFYFVAIPNNADRNNTLKKVLCLEKPDIIINDILNASEATLKIEKDSATRLLCLDDNKHGTQYADTVINPIVFHETTFPSLENRCPYFAGPPYMILDSRFTDSKATKCDGGHQGEKILITLGGTDTWDITTKVIRSLSPFFKQKNFQFSTTIGPGFTNKNKLIRWINEFSNHTVTIYPNPPWLGEVMLNHDLIICGGGITLYETATLGIPILAIANEPHEIQNIDYFLQEGNVLAYVGYRNEWPKARLQQLLKTTTSVPTERLKCRKKGLNLVDGKGLQRTLDIISNLCGNGTDSPTTENCPN